VEIKGEAFKNLARCICFERVSGAIIEGVEEGRSELYMCYYILDKLVLAFERRLYPASFTLNSLITSLSMS